MFCFFSINSIYFIDCLILLSVLPMDVRDPMFSREKEKKNKWDSENEVGNKQNHIETMAVASG